MLQQTAGGRGAKDFPQEDGGKAGSNDDHDMEGEAADYLASGRFF